MWQPVLVTPQSCPSGAATRPLQPVMWKWDRGLELPRPFVGTRAFRHAHPPATKRRYKLQRSGTSSLLGRRGVRQWDPSIGQSRPVLTWPDIVGQPRSESPEPVMKEEAEEEANAAAKPGELPANDTLFGDLKSGGTPAKGTEWRRGSRQLLSAGAQSAVPTVGPKGKRRQLYSPLGCKRRKEDPTAAAVRPVGAGWAGPAGWAAYHIAVKRDGEPLDGGKLRLQLARRMVPRPQKTEGLEEELAALVRQQAAEAR
eukprot:EG_transcript_23323